MTAKTIMVMGTSSSAGKSLLTTALCRCFSRRGFRVAPFKAQNMSNNAAVCSNGAEVGRSQALQAIAAGTPLHSDMNPILLKPEGHTRSQVIVNGRPHTTLEAVDYFQRRQQLWPHVTAALDRLRQQYDVVVIEGAGSPAELNLADVELVNMSVARYCQSPVLLVGDIERGGVFAQLLGTLWLLTPEDRKLIKALLVNKFRGDLSLFDSGVEILEQRSGVNVLGVIPWIEGLQLPEEDAQALTAPALRSLVANDSFTQRLPKGKNRRLLGQEGNHNSKPSLCQTPCTDPGPIEIAVIHLPHIANFDDFDPLATEPSVCLRYVRGYEQLGSPHAVILPGTKNTIGDLQWLRDTGLASRIQQLAQSGTAIVGICGGYQMLGARIDNPYRLESEVEHVTCLGLLNVTTTFDTEKQTCQVQWQIMDEAVVPGMVGHKLDGYEIHNGQTTSKTAWLKGSPASDGAHASAGRIWGSYLHGLFHNDAFRIAWLNRLSAATVFHHVESSHAKLEHSLNLLADVFEANIDFDRLMEIVFDSALVQETHHGR